MTFLDMETMIWKLAIVFVANFAEVARVLSGAVVVFIENALCGI